MRIWSELVEDARWSPSPHNIQGWLVRPVDAVRAELLAHPERLLPETDPGGRFGTVGLGMFVESLSIAAADRGLALDVDLNGRRLAEALEAPFASLSLRSGRTDEPLGVDLLRARRTSRLPYDGRQVDDSLLRELEQLAGTAGHRLRYSSDPSLVADILALNEDTLFFDMTDPAARNEVGGLLRFSDREARARSDGFSPAALGFPGWLLRLFFRSHRVLDAPVGTRRGSPPLPEDDARDAHDRLAARPVRGDARMVRGRPAAAAPLADDDRPRRRAASVRLDRDERLGERARDRPARARAVTTEPSGS